MIQKISRLLKNKKAAAFFMLLLMLIVLFVFFMVIVEEAKVFTVTYEVETQLRRLANNVVEDNIDDEWRMDGYNYLNTAEAEQDFIDHFQWYTETTPDLNNYITASGIVHGNKYDRNDGSFLYLIDITEIHSSRGDHGSDPVMTCKGRLYIAPSIPGALNNTEAHPGNFVFDIPIEIESTNFRTDNGLSSSVVSMFTSSS